MPNSSAGNPGSALRGRLDDSCSSEPGSPSIAASTGRILGKTPRLCKGKPEGHSRELHGHRGVEEMDAQGPLLPGSASHDVFDRQRRGIRGQNRRKKENSPPSLCREHDQTPEKGHAETLSVINARERDYKRRFRIFRRFSRESVDCRAVFPACHFDRMCPRSRSRDSAGGKAYPTKSAAAHR